MTEHTKGPWEAYNNDGYSIWRVISLGGRLLAEVIGDDARTDANARLIAAAPDLLAALENMMGAYDTPVSRRRYPPDEFITEALQSARAAIARARGTEVA